MTLNELLQELEKDNLSRYFSLVAYSNNQETIKVNLHFNNIYSFSVNIRKCKCVNDFLLESMKEYGLKTIKDGVFVFETYPINKDGEVLDTLTPFILFDSNNAYDFLKNNNLSLSVDIHAPIYIKSEIKPKEYYILNTIKDTNYKYILSVALMFELLIEIIENS